MPLQQMAESQDRHRIRRPIINGQLSKFPIQMRVAERFPQGLIGKVEPLLQEIFL
ncbi:hypothetical protein FHR87_000521 [Azomonas macrocytogenes]|uniref:Uncharacterized protein n=1 Tax=Azomonas macrocytogenes TaxID=69962 RepID=A0A839SZ40_AZOMA|nr:hypothetical protein [Azomonas macrocytogenes]MBB3102148.1 hypothetical protein [Azomonas macrocytogenes]